MYLLGIRDKSQLFTHPLLGNIFENMVVMEKLKQRLNAGYEPDMWFYRNSSGSIEVDLMVEEAGWIYPMEIKSAATYSAGMRKHLDEFVKLESRAKDPLVIYSGTTYPGQAVNFMDYFTRTP